MNKSSQWYQLKLINWNTAVSGPFIAESFIVVSLYLWPILVLTRLGEKNTQELRLLACVFTLDVKSGLFSLLR